MKAINVRVDYLKNPLGLVNASPRFYWNCDGGVSQSAYQIVCLREEEVIWDSGKVSSSSMTHIFSGKAGKLPVIASTDGKVVEEGAPSYKLFVYTCSFFVDRWRL